MPVRYPKEQMHRIKYTKLTPEQIGAKQEYVKRDGIWTPHRITYRSV